MKFDFDTISFFIGVAITSVLAVLGLYLQHKNHEEQLAQQAKHHEAEIITAAANKRDKQYSDALNWKSNGGNTNLRGYDLSMRDLSGVDLSYADLRGAILVDAILEKANLSRAKLNNADLSRAKLIGATLWEADLSRAILDNTDLSEARLSGAYLGDADLSQAKNLKNAILFDAPRPMVIGRQGTINAIYNAKTLWPDDFDPIAAGCILEQK